ncbi:putative RNA recognition motif domain, nucleotide-binding alpha-beta plait domain superfamily [Helianthus annuus]|uniref:Putative nucleotide-binding alpha-beta plait domain-containing protein n=1 Tax=Helianthus annuus TaxID=4232 RepID=A0A251SBN8_HELAN|nr:polyadenylate-binding protein-interacting protein 9 [Helianthus annuus]KAF5766498.1 putative RNA recognition motif domain, nucleotide-binding alpha-beta plait domain superfamily [Helianthus annuus]KAJ0452867.1 putative RNA recognition motif domain, nucleotide-binding alpha-beta plait domain superfamily [Helianthus annuus]KAJ0474783.1 putative RNA recognition motif domain, nucleotide-binding alpha-beta plait domain superfamily [Helianthus annuus]KAJ0650337.1 putative RNA recognition motif dom
MAAVPDDMNESENISVSNSNDSDSISDLLSSVDLNPLADVFDPFSDSSLDSNDHPFEFPPLWWMRPSFPEINGFLHNRMMRCRFHQNKYNRGRRQSNGRNFKAQREDRIKRTIYVSDIDHNVTKDRLVALFSTYGQVLDCRVCGDPHSRLRFAFLEFADKNSARSALNLSGMMMGFSQITVLPSKTAILPVNPTFLPKSDDEKEICARTVYCTNIDKKVSRDEVKNFFEARCGEVSHIKLSGDHVHSRIAFVEFVSAESAIMALDCSGQTLGSQKIRVSPSKTPVKGRVARSPSTN